MALHDVQAKQERGYISKNTVVYATGREILAGPDWKKRKQELWDRAQGRCEYITSDGERCRSEGHDPDHIIPRSRGRHDDRIANLQLLCRLHHDLKHPEKNKIHWSKR